MACYRVLVATSSKLSQYMVAAAACFCWHPSQVVYVTGSRFGSRVRNFWKCEVTEVGLEPVSSDNIVFM